MDCGQLLIYYRGIWFLTTAGELRRLKILTVLSVWKHIGAVEEEFYSNFHFKIGIGYKVRLLEDNGAVREICKVLCPL